MTFPVDSGRQYPLAMLIPIDFSQIASGDLVSGTKTLIASLPPNATVLRTAVNVVTAFNSATSDALDVGHDATDNAFAAGVDLQAVAYTAGTSELGFKPTGKDGVYATWTGVGAAPTAGHADVIVEYLIDGRANEAQPG